MIDKANSPHDKGVRPRDERPVPVLWFLVLLVIAGLIVWALLP